MAERCPGSTFIGKATLRGYKWQINQRHVANIVKVTEDVSSGPAGQADVVEGLVFSITDKDRRDSAIARKASNSVFMNESC